jgi:NADPH2:quinone reductase
MAMQIPQTQEGVVINQTGGTEVLEYKTDLAVPSPKEGQVLVKNEYTGINYIDTCDYNELRVYVLQADVCLKIL